MVHSKITQPPLAGLNVTILSLLFAFAAAAYGASPNPRTDSGRPERLALGLILQGERALAAGELDLGESLLREGLLEAWLVRAAMASSLDETQTAERSYQAALRISAEERRPLLGTALVAFEKGQLETANLTLRRVLERSPTDLIAKRWIAHVLAAEGHEEEAVQELRELVNTSKAADEAPEPSQTTVELMFTLGTGLLRTGEVSEAITLFEELTLKDPRAETYVLVGRTLRDFRQLEPARAMLERALAIDPEAARANFYLASVELLIDGPQANQKAITAYRRELRNTPDEPWLNFHLGIVLMETRLYQEAADALERAVKPPSPSVGALHVYGTVLVRLSRDQEAVETLGRALASARSEGSAPEQLSSIRYQLGLAHRNLGNQASATEHFNAAKQSSAQQVSSARSQLTLYLDDSSSADLTDQNRDRSLVLGAMQAPRYPATDPDSLRLAAAALDRRMGSAYYNLGLLLLQKDEAARAADLFEIATQTSPETQYVHALSVAQFRAGNYREAVTGLERALASTSGTASLAFDPMEARRMLAVAQMQSGQFDVAADLLLSDPATGNDPNLQYVLGTALIRGGRREQAALLLDSLVARHEGWAPLQVLLGQAKAQTGDFEAAVEHLEKALELNPDVQDAHSGLGMIALREGRLEQAEQHYLAELERQPNSLELEYLLANVLERSQQLERASNLLFGVLRRDPEHANARYLLGKIQLARGLLVEAAQHLATAVQLAPGNYNAHYQLGICLQRLGRADESSAAFAEYRRLKATNGDSPQADPLSNPQLEPLP